MAFAESIQTVGSRLSGTLPVSRTCNFVVRRRRRISCWWRRLYAGIKRGCREISFQVVELIGETGKARVVDIVGENHVRPYHCYLGIVLRVKTNSMREE